jgi:hypothetical protein
MSGLNSARDQIQSEWNILNRQWQVSCDQWRDVVRQHFQQEVWHDFERTVPSMLKEMKCLADTIARARQEVP